MVSLAGSRIGLFNICHFPKFSLKKKVVIFGHPSLSFVVFSDLFTDILISGDDAKELEFENSMIFFVPPACPTNPMFKNKAKVSIGIFGRLKLDGTVSDTPNPNPTLEPCSANLSLISSTEAKPEATAELWFIKRDMPGNILAIIGVKVKLLLEPCCLILKAGVT